MAWRKWTQAEDQIILDKLSELGPAGLAKYLPGRTLSAIQAHAQVLGKRGRDQLAHVADPTPPWATSTTADRLENKAACVLVLYLRRRQLANVDRQALADALGVSRWTLERYMATVDRIPEYLDALDELLKRLKG